MNEKTKIAQRLYYLQHKEQIAKQHKKYREKNHQKLLEDKKKYYRENQEIFKDRNLRKYGVTAKQYNELFEAQKGCCAICTRSQEGLVRALAVDHCHVTGTIRGLLCIHCNMALGQFQDNLAILKNAIIYLENNLCKR